MNKVKVSIVIEDDNGDTLTISRSGDPLLEMEEALLHALIPAARVMLGVPDDDVWTFGTPDE